LSAFVFTAPSVCCTAARAHALFAAAEASWRTAREALEARVAQAETAAQQALRDSSKVRPVARPALFHCFMVS
jgi:hypothetical protein